MAEAIAIIGVVAAAAQFSATGSKLVSRLISLKSRIGDSPQCIQLTLDQVRMLVSLAELTKKKIAEEHGTWMPTVAPSSRDEQESSPQSSEVSPLTWLESVWQNCLAQACELDDLIRQMLQKAESNLLQKGWRKLCTLKTEEQIDRILVRIERYKTLLSTWYGQECLDHIKNLGSNVNDLHGELSSLRQSMDYLNENVHRMMVANASDPHKPSRQALQGNEDRLAVLSNEQALIVARQQQQRHIPSPTQQHAKYLVSQGNITLLQSKD